MQTFIKYKILKLELRNKENFSRNCAMHILSHAVLSAVPAAHISKCCNRSFREIQFSHRILIMGFTYHIRKWNLSKLRFFTLWKEICKSWWSTKLLICARTSGTCVWSLIKGVFKHPLWVSYFRWKTKAKM